MHTMEELINVNVGSIDSSIMKRREITDADRTGAALRGFFTGLGIMIGIALVVAIILGIKGTILEVIESDAIKWAFPLLLGSGAALGVVINTARLRKKEREGYLKIDNEVVEYWTAKGIVKIPLENIFGAGKIKSGWGYDLLRIYYTDWSPRGFRYSDYGFRNYEAVAGPVMKVAYGSNNGHDIARNGIIHHYNLRKSKGLRVAELPDYRFQSVQVKKEHLIYGETVEVASFSCDGKTLVYTTQTDKYEILVKYVKDIRVKKLQSKYGVMEWKVTVFLKLASGFEEIVINIRDLPHAQEIDNYLRCLPTLFPFEEPDGYWS